MNTDEYNSPNLLLKALVIAAGILMGLIISALAAFGVFKYITNSQYQKELETFNQNAVKNNFLHVVFPELQTRMEKEFGVHINQKYDIFYNTTPFEQPLDDKLNLSFFELADESELKDTTKLTYINLLNKMYINASIKEIYDYPPELNQLIRYKEPGAIKYPTDIYINGMSKIEDGNNSKVNNELRSAIILFIKGYLGLPNLSQVTVAPTEESTLHHAFVLTINSTTQDTQYQFSYGYDAQEGDVRYVIVERVW